MSFLGLSLQPVVERVMFFREAAKVTVGTSELLETDFLIQRSLVPF